MQTNDSARKPVHFKPLKSSRTLTVSLNNLEFTVAVSMKPPWLGETQGGDTETNVKYGKYSFVVPYQNIFAGHLNFAV